jgi:ferric-dicitrate binding protein FerR (iron transport regulator)
LLTLADGSTIVLNDEQNGELASQGNTKVLKLNGRITYQPSDVGSGKILYNTITTPRGGQYQVVLADGSSVWLNAESSLRFPTDFVGKERRVEISGEAYFEVAKNKAMPFVVSVNGAEVQVLGTHFNVQAYDDEAALQTTLLEGAVKFVAGNSAVTLKPGQQSQLDKNGDVTVSNEIDTDKIVAWKNGYFLFNGEGLSAITKQLARWYDVEVTGANKIGDKFYAEIPRATKLSDVLHALELTGKVHFTIEGRKVVAKP